jgi:hypothetical protein
MRLAAHSVYNSSSPLPQQRVRDPIVDPSEHTKKQKRRDWKTFWVSVFYSVAFAHTSYSKAYSTYCTVRAHGAE